jgi:SAM-dependent methyltransferase
VTADDHTDLVRRGYDALSYHYRADDAGEGRYAPWLAGLRDRLPPGAAVLDVGCGCGVPVARSLAAAGHAVTGVDLSEVQVDRARRLVPAATFLAGDATDMWWSQADAATYRSWLGAAGLDVVSEEFAPEGGGGHALFWARKPAAAPPQLWLNGS